jgi:hypothetical protein
MYWNLRSRFERGEMSGLDDETLGELAAITRLVEVRGRRAIESKESVRSTLGRSPDQAEALCMALGQYFERPVVTLAPSDLWLKQPAPDH